MKESIINLSKMIICTLLIFYGVDYYLEIVANLGINAEDTSALIWDLIYTGYYLFLAFVIYYLYKSHLKEDFSSYMRKWFPNILMTVVYFAIFTIVVWIVSYIAGTVAESLAIGYTGLSFYNVFDSEFNITLILFILRNIIIIPFALSTTFVLGVYDLIDSKKTCIFFTGLLAALAYGLMMSGNLSFIFFNVISYFTMFLCLSYIYHKNSYNICFSTITFILYSLLASMLIERIV